MNFKNILKIVLLISVVSLTFYSCQKDDQTDPNPSTSTADRDKFLGTWSTQSNGTSGPLSFNMTITAGASSASQIKISNFDNEGTGTFVLAEVSGNSVTLTPTLIGNDNITGSGTYNSNNTLSFSYTISDGQTVDTRTASAHK